MFAVIFEVVPKPEQFTGYLDLAKVLRPEIERIDGFINNERFESQHTRGRILSLSIWRDEKALIRWRTLAVHHRAQEQGRFAIFHDYHLRVGEITADTGVPPGQSLAQQRFDATATGDAKFVTISELPAIDGQPAGSDVARDLGMPKVGANGLVACETWESITTPGKLLVLGSWRDAAAAEAWKPATRQTVAPRHRVVRVIRDYGMFDRREAPQYYDDVRR